MRGSSSALLIAVILITTCCRVLDGGVPSLIRLSDGERDYTGRLEKMSQALCWLVQRDGRLQEFEIDKLKSFKKVGTRFLPFTDSEVRSELLREFGREYEVRGTRHFLVCAARGRARHFAPIFEDVYGAFHREFTTRGFTIKEPEFPMVAIVFADRSSYLAYCKRDESPGAAAAVGYYSPRSNRIALSERPRTVQRRTGPNDNPIRTALGGSPRRCSSCAGGVVLPTIDASLESTLIHETTHQIAFNTGLHKRIGDTPRWTVEGLATLFEAPGIRNRSPGRATAARVNRERYVWYGNYRKSRRKPRSLEAFIASDAKFGSGHALDAYSEAWALTFYLFETRTTTYAKYLKRISERDPLEKYTAKQRVADFKAEFGEDIERLEGNLLRYYDRLQL